jgi:hypothetical protein
MHALRSAAATCLAILVCASLAAQAPDPVQDLLKRSNQYVQELEKQLAVVIADETYVQALWARGARQIASRTIKSEALFMQLPNEDVWLFVRNVLNVDGRAVADSKDRLDRVLAAPGFDYVARLRAIDAESARYDLGQVWRTTGYPTLALRFLLPAYQPRFTFTASGQDRIGGEPVSKIRFAERDGPTVIQVNAANVRSSGIMWLRPSDGGVVKTFVALALPSSLKVSIDVNFAIDARLGLLVPVRMDERYDEISGSSTRCSARYSNFRRFETSGRLIVPR